MRFRPTLAATSFLALLFTLTSVGCSDLEVTNPNEPGREAAVGNPDAVEALISGAFETWHDAQYQTTGPSVGLSAASFQHSSPWACPGAQEYLSRIPRNAVPNELDHVECGTVEAPWETLYSAIAPLADGMAALVENPELMTAEGEDARSRIMAFGRFVQGVSHGSLAILFDRAFIRDETTDLNQAEPAPYDTVLAAALGYLEEAAELAEGRSWTIPAQWMSVDVSADQLVRLAHSYAARFRAAVARTPTERAAVDWDAVIADVDAGITEDWVMDMDYHAGWYAPSVDLTSYPGRADETYWIVGMADQSGNYQAWLQLRPTNSAAIPNPDLDGDGEVDPILIVTPDTRFPQGTTLAEQEANPGSLYVIPDGLEGQIGGQDRAWGIRDVWNRPDRGTWRWSYYWSIGAEMYTRWVDLHWPEVTLAEMRLLKAEGLLRTGGAAQAASLINASRTAAGLSPTDAVGTNDSCVPRLPDGTCGDLMEMLKWEKRLETRLSGLMAAPWYFEGRGWGDLFTGTFTQFPIPCRDLTVLDMLPCYTFGGTSEEGVAPVSVYAWPAEVN